MDLIMTNYQLFLFSQAKVAKVNVKLLLHGILPTQQMVW